MSDEDLAAAANDEATARRRGELRDLATVLETPAGARVLLRLLHRSGPLRQTFDANSERISSLRAGERNIGLWLLGELSEARPDAIGALCAELQKPSRLDAATS